ncbi:MAG TPA: hypothetical protein VH309_07340 [Elusimicrobiota bacterium]|jgi:hypothetical protein|nr:hypothetical protein [Elusimicrobiota bacterium]
MGRARAALTAALLLALSWVLLAWTRSATIVPDVFPLELAPARALALQAAGLLLGAAAFAAAGGRGRARLGAAFGLAMSAIGWCASRWPQLARALDLSGATFVGPFVGGALATGFALTAAGVAVALLLKDLRPRALLLVAAAALLWAAPTLATEAVLSRWWGFGPRTLVEAAGIPTGESPQTAAILLLAPSRGRPTTRETVRMTQSLQDVRPDEGPSTGVDLAPESIAKLEGFLRNAGYRGVFAAEALAHVRRGWLMWWDADHALDAMMLSVPGRVIPDYRGALDLIKVGPMTAERYAKLEQLDAEATADPRTGFEQVTASQYIFEGFAAAYARFGKEEEARKWLSRIDNLLLVTEKKVEVAPLEDFRDGKISGLLTLDGRPAGGVMVGLFEVWRTTPTDAGEPLLSGSTFPDANGRFAFSDLGPGEYELALLGRLDDLSGRVVGSPGPFEIGYTHPSAALLPIQIERDILPVPASFHPGAPPDTAPPVDPEPPLLWQKK